MSKNKIIYKNKSIYKYGKYLAISTIWYFIGRCNRENLHNQMYNKGYQLSQKMKKYDMWDKYAEPFLIKQFSVVFTVCHSFIEGMISDNENKDKIKMELENMHRKIIDEINHGKK